MPKQILLVEDSVTMQKVVQIAFAKEDYTVGTATGVDEALAKCKTSRPDLVLADASLPGKTGYDLATALRAEAAYRDVPILLLTSHFNQFDEARAQKAGIDGHLVKPFDTQSLIDKVATLLKGRSVGTPDAKPAPAVVAKPAVVEAAKPMTAATADIQRSTLMGVSPQPAASKAATPAPAPVAVSSARNAPSNLGLASAAAPAAPAIEGNRMTESVRPASGPAAPAGSPSSLPTMPRPSLIPRAPVPAPVLAAMERIAARGAEYDAIAKLSLEAIQQIVWEVVPELAEAMLRVEIEKKAKEKRS
jgi:CheY-like chemotaxis protein